MACPVPCPDHSVCPDLTYNPEATEVQLEVDVNALLGSKYCVGCYPENKYAVYTYNGNSLCVECFILKRSDHWL